MTPAMADTERRAHAVSGIPPTRIALAALVVAGVVAITITMPGLNLADARAYWDPSISDPYAGAGVGAPGAYLYAPAFIQALAPLKGLPWPAFAFVWLAASAVVLYRLVGPAAIVVALVPPVLMELQVGNIHLFLALAIGLGLRRPWMWGVVLLTKPTLGIGLLWWATRREWRALAEALGATALVAAISFVLAPDLWRQWIDLLAQGAANGLPADYNGVIHVSIWLRLPVAAALVVWGARGDRRWTLGVAATLSLPVLWVNGLAVLLAIPLLEAGVNERVRSWWRQRSRPLAG